MSTLERQGKPIRWDPYFAKASYGKPGFLCVFLSNSKHILVIVAALWVYTLNRVYGEVYSAMGPCLPAVTYPRLPAWQVMADRPQGGPKKRKPRILFGSYRYLLGVATVKKLLWMLGLLVIGLGVGVAILFWTHPFWFKKPIKIGILHSQTGTLGVNEQRLINAELLAIEEINNQGGINGRKIQAIIADGKSDETVFEQEAIRLITQEKVEVIIGCWASSARKRVKAVVEHYNNLLLYPVVYEGLEESANIVYFGGTPNQTTIPAITWAFQRFGKRFFLIGSDYVFSQVTHKIIELHLASLGGTVVGTTYIKPGGKVLPEQIKQIADLKPDIVINTINGDTNISFFKELLNAGIASTKIPSMSMQISQADFQRFELKAIIGTYVLFNYAEESSYSFNKEFIKKFRKKYGQDSKVGDAGQSAYSLIHVWAQAYAISKNSKPELIIPEMKKMVYQSPSGIIYMSENQNCWQDAIINKLAYNGDLLELWKSKSTIRPEVYPPYLTKDEWNQFMNNLYKNWGNRWSAV